jgi:glycosyltransferase involved in cell wall biosynthesis
MLAQEHQVTRTDVPLNQEAPVAIGCRSKAVLFITNTEAYGGLETHLLEMVRRFRGPGAQPSILNIGPDVYTEHMDRDEIARVSISCKTGPISFWRWFRFFRSAQPDVVVFTCGWYRAFRFAPIAAWLAGVRKRFTIQQLAPPSPSRVKPGSLKSMLRRFVGGNPRRATGVRLSAYFCQKTICVSNSVRDTLVQDYLFPADRAITIYNGISVSKFVPSESEGAAVRAKLGVGPDEFLLVCAARLNEVKRVDILLQALSKLSRDGVRCKCVIVGDGPLRGQLTEQASALGISGQVFFEGFREDIRPYLSAATAFVLTSSAEGLPLSILEAMACGLPCIVTNVGGNAEAVTTNVHGLVVPFGSADAVADAISYLAAHPQERERMSRMTRARVCETFDIENRIADIKNIVLA